MDEPPLSAKDLQARLDEVERKLAEIKAGPPGLSGHVGTNAPPQSAWARFWQTPRLALRMFIDPRYKVSKLGQFVLPAFAILVAVNYFTWNYLIPVIGFSTVAERAALIFLAAATYHVLTIEVERYKAVLDYLARYGSSS